MIIFAKTLEAESTLDVPPETTIPELEAILEGIFTPSPEPVHFRIIFAGKTLTQESTVGDCLLDGAHVFCIPMLGSEVSDSLNHRQDIGMASHSRDLHISCSNSALCLV